MANLINIYGLSDKDNVPLRVNSQDIIARSAIRTTTFESSVIHTANFGSCILLWDWTIRGGGNITPSIVGVDNLSGNEWTISTWAAQSTTGFRKYSIQHHTNSVPAGHTDTDRNNLPAYIKVKLTHSNSAAQTYTIALDLLLE